MLVLESSSIMLMLYFVDFVVSFPSYFLKPSVALNEFIKHYEPAFFDAEEVTNQQKRVKRGAENYEENSAPLKLTIFTSNRKFKLLLRPDQSLFADDVQFEGAKGRKINFDTGTAYVGTLEGDERTKVHGIITGDGLFDGTVTTQFEEFYIEPVSRYKISSENEAATGSHTIVYKISDVVHPISPLCAISDTRTKQKPTDLNTIAHRSKRRKRGTTSHRVQNQNEMISKLTGKLSSTRYDDAQQEALHDEQVQVDEDNDKWPKFTNFFTRRSGGKSDHKLKMSQHSADSHRILENFGQDFSKTNDEAPTKAGLPTLLTSHLPTVASQEHDSSDISSNLDGAYYDLDFFNFSPDWNTANKKWQDEEGKQYDFNDDQFNRFKPSNDTVHEMNSKHWRPKTGLIDTVYKYTNTTKNSKGYSPSSGIIQKTNPKILIGNGAEESRANLIITSDDSLEQHARKRAIVDPKKTTCMLYLQADHLFYEKYGTEETCIEVMTRHVQRVNSIYRNTDFNQDGKPDNISFMIKRIKVHSMKDPAYRFPGNYGVEKFLEIFSEEDYDSFCLAYMFTYRDFEMGTLGLAWTGDLKNAGGVCEKNGHYRGSLKSLNTGIVTVLNYGKHVPSAVSHVTLAHEIGHNFGSPHDPDGCTPGGDDGNFIMFARATSGDKKNNNKFSPCSLHAINPVLNVKARSSKGCFTEPQTSICGNGVVEPGEECDCGWEEDCKDTCCYPQRRYPPVDETPCRLTPNAFCSPSQGPCCTTDCKIKNGDMCRNDNGCRDSSYCDGKSSHCPASVNKPNKTVCNEEFVCYMGECTGSICLAYGLESCQCIPSPSDPPIKACELCCKMPGENQPCLSSFQWNQAPYDVPDKYAKPGTPCNDYNGYCDVFRKCREVDPSGPIATLRKLLLSEENIASFKKWAFDHWYYCGLIFLIFILLMILSTKILGKKPKVKAVTVVHSSPTETVRLPTDGSGGPTIVVHPTAVRSKLPFKKKVHENKRRIKSAQKEEPVPHNVNNNNSPVEAKKKAKRHDNKAVAKLSKTKVQKSSKKEIAVGVPTNKASVNISEDPLGKVRNWLINSHNIDGLGSLKKSKSSPAGFDLSADQTAATAAAVVAKKRPNRTNAVTTSTAAVTKTTPSNTAKNDVKNPKKSKDTRVKLQVVYKPPFKFSLKLGKHKNEISSQLIKDKRPEAVKQRAALLVRADRIRINGIPSVPVSGVSPPIKTPTPAVKGYQDKSKSLLKSTTETLAKGEPSSSRLRVEYKRSVSAPQPEHVYENTVYEATAASLREDMKAIGEEPQYANIAKDSKNDTELRCSLNVDKADGDFSRQNCGVGMKRRNSGEIRVSAVKQHAIKANPRKRRNSCDAGRATNRQPLELLMKRQYSDETDMKPNQKRVCSSDELKRTSTQQALRTSSRKSIKVSGGSSKPVRLKNSELEGNSEPAKRKNSRDNKITGTALVDEWDARTNERSSHIRRSMSNNGPQNDSDKFKRYSLQNVDLTKFPYSEQKNGDVPAKLNRDLFELSFQPAELMVEKPSDLEVLLSETENTRTEGG